MDLEKQQLLSEIEDMKERLRVAIDIVVGSVPWHPQLGYIKGK